MGKVGLDWLAGMSDSRMVTGWRKTSPCSGRRKERKRPILSMRFEPIARNRGEVERKIEDERARGWRARAGLSQFSSEA